MPLLPLFDQDFPNYTKEIFGNVDVYWYQADFSQSRYPPGQAVSKACTLICLLVAQHISQLDLQISDIERCPQFNAVMAEAIIEGNSIHSYIVRKKLVPHPYLNAEEALKFGGRKLNALKEWKFNVFPDKLYTSLYRNMKFFLCDWYKSPKSLNLFMLLITCGRTILLIFQQKTRKVILFDSHGHSNIKYSNRGLVVAQSAITSLEEVCDWYIKYVIHNCEHDCQFYELACFYQQHDQQQRGSNSCYKCKCKAHPTKNN